MVTIATTIITNTDIAIIKKELKSPDWSVDKIIKKLNHTPTKQAVEHQIKKLIAEEPKTKSKSIMQTKDDVINEVYDLIDIEKPEEQEIPNMSGGRPWTKEEEEIVKANYENLGAAKIVKVKLLKNRTAAAISAKAAAISAKAATLGLKSPLTKVRGSGLTENKTDDITAIKTNTPVKPDTNIIDFNSVAGLIAILNGIKESSIIQRCDISVKFDDSLYFKYKKDEVDFLD